MKIRSATISDIPKLKELWFLSFGDDEEYLDLFFLNRFQPNFTAVLCVDDRIIGSIYLLPCVINRSQRAFYWYSVSIHPDFRGKGYFRYFIQFVLAGTQNKGYANVCLPVRGLTAVYQKYGFKYPYFSREITATVGKGDIELNISDAMADDFIKIQQKEGSVLWDRDAISYAIMENQFCGGKSFKFKFNGKLYVALAVNKNDHFYLDSTNLTEKTFLECSKALLEYLETDKIVLNTFDLNGNNQKIAGLSDTKPTGAGATLHFTLS